MAILGRAHEMQGALRRAMDVYQEALELASEPMARLLRRYGKLGVERRTQAVAKARESGLL